MYVSKEIGKQINKHHWVLSPHCTVDYAMTSEGEGGGQIVITWTYIVISAWGHHLPPHTEYKLRFAMHVNKISRNIQ